MAVFDTNLMLRNTIQSVGTLLSFAGGLIGFTSNWLTLGTKVAGPVPIRVSIQTAASNTDTMDLHFEQSDDQSAINEDMVISPTGTELGANGLGGTTPPDILRKIHARRKYIRVRGVGRGLNVNYGVVAIGVDASDTNPYR